MFPELQDYGLIFVSLAVFGFIILDIFRTGQYYGIPNYYKSSVEKILHYISTAVFVLSIILVLMWLIILDPNKENAITKFVNELISIIGGIIEISVLNGENYTAIVQIFKSSSLLAFFYIVIYTIVFYLGSFFRIININKLNVFLKSNPNEAKPFSSLITESDDFFFFLKDGGTNLWEAIRKDDVARFERIEGRSWLEIRGQDLIQSLRNQIENLYKKNKEKNPDKNIGRI